MNAKMTVDPKGMKKIMDKLTALGDVGKKILHEEAKTTAKRTRDAARRDFKQQDSDPSNLKSNIRYKTVKRKKSDSAYEVTTNADKEPIMAYIEFGTRDKKGGDSRMSFKGITQVFGSEGRAHAAKFKKQNAKRFTARRAKPYFYHNAYKEYQRFKGRISRELQKAMKK